MLEFKKEKRQEGSRKTVEHLELDYDALAKDVKALKEDEQLTLKIEITSQRDRAVRHIRNALHHRGLTMKTIGLHVVTDSLKGEIVIYREQQQ